MLAVHPAHSIPLEKGRGGGVEEGDQSGGGEDEERGWGVAKGRGGRG